MMYDFITLSQTVEWWEKLDWAGIAALLSGLYIVYKGLRTQPQERDSAAAAAAKGFAEAAKTAADRAESYYNELEDSRKEMSAINRSYREVIRIVNDWRSGIKILILQLEAAGLVPNWKPNKDDDESISKMFRDSE